MTNIPIFLASDDTYAPFIATTIASICDNTESFIDFYILDDDIANDNKTKIIKLKKTFNNFSIEFIKINTKKIFKDFDVTMYFSRSMYSRFLIPQLKPNLEKVIYLDVDISVLGDIKELYDISLDSYALGAIKSEGQEKFTDNVKNILNLSEDSIYFNSGVLLIDCKKWRTLNIINNLLIIEKTFRGKLQCVDQDILNKYFDQNYKIIEDKFNVQYGAKDTIIRHFINYAKPWRTNFYIHNNKVKPLPNFDDFWHYARITEFYNDLKSSYDKAINSNILNKRMSIVAEKIKLERKK